MKRTINYKYKHKHKYKYKYKNNSSRVEFSQVQLPVNLPSTAAPDEVDVDTEYFVTFSKFILLVLKLWNYFYVLDFSTHPCTAQQVCCQSALTFPLFLFSTEEQTHRLRAQNIATHQTQYVQRSCNAWCHYWVHPTYWFHFWSYSAGVPVGQEWDPVAQLHGQDGGRGCKVLSSSIILEAVLSQYN